MNADEVLLVLKMYAKNDYDQHFLASKLNEITHRQFIDLFKITLQNDAMKTAMHIYLRYLTAFDINNEIMDTSLEK